MIGNFEQYHPVVKQIISLLEERKMWYEFYEHEPVRTSEEAAAIRTGYTLDQGAKALVVRVKKRGGEKFFAMLVLPGSSQFSAKIVCERLGAKDIRFANAQELAEITGGVEPGGVPPLGNLFDLPVYVDPGVLENEKIIFNAGDRRVSVAMKSEDFEKVVKPDVVELS